MSPSRPASPHRIHVELDGVEVLRAPLVGRLVLGRDPDCDLCLPDASRTTSRRHLEIWVEGGIVWAQDLSRAGTWVGDDPLGPLPRRLRARESLRLGPWWVSVQSDQRSEESTVHPAAVPRDDEVSGFPGIVARAPVMRRSLAEARRLASFDLPVLVLGETGSGKEGVARGIHETSRRRGAWTPVNCAALHPETALATLFGHERGAFTGAIDKKTGAIREAHGGTLFLDEVGELSAELQAALLRVLETRQVVPVGATRPVDVDFRLVAATHRNLPMEVERGRFREDLWYRLAVGVVHVPPLRERPEDVPPLVALFLQQHAAGVVPRVTAAALDRLTRQPWKGNVRELRNTILRALVSARGGVIDLAHLGLPTPEPPVDRDTLQLLQGERQQLKEAIGRAGGNHALAARRLGISRSTLYLRLGRGRR